MEEMEPRTLKILQRFHAALSLPLITSTLVTHDPLAASRDQADARIAKDDGGSGVAAAIHLIY